MPRRFFGAGSTPFGCASRPPGRSAFTHFSSDHLGSSEAVDGGSEHGARHMHRVMAGVWKMAGSIEHDGDLTVGVQLHERGCRPRR